MNRSLESMLRFVNVTTAGFLAGSLGFATAGGTDSLSGFWHQPGTEPEHESSSRMVNTIGPVALATSVTLAIAAGRQPLKRTLDVLSTLSLAGVVASSMLGTTPRTGNSEPQAASDYVTGESTAQVRNWSRARSVRTALGISAFVLSVASNMTAKSSSR